MRFRYSLHNGEEHGYFQDRAKAIEVGRAYARLLGRPVQLQMEYAYNEDPNEWHLGCLSILQPQTRFDNDDVIV